MNEDPVWPAHFVRKPVWIHPQMEGGGGVYVKYWPSGGGVFARTGALTRADTVYIYIYMYIIYIIICRNRHSF